MSTAHDVIVNGHKIHYLTEGQGKPVIFIHGVPTSSFIWRNILPVVAKNSHCIALDLIGMGFSDKPAALSYTIEDHIHYFSNFIDALEIKEFTLMMHGWGSVIGFSYARQYPEKIAGLAFVESYMHLPENPQDIPLPVQELSALAHDPEKMKSLIIDQNILIEKMLPGITLNKISAEELGVYRQPFEDKAHRKVLFQFGLEQPYRNPKSPVHGLIKEYSYWLETTPIRKLLMYGIPGFLTSMNTVTWAMKSLPNLTAVEVGEGLHYLPESRCIEIAKTLSEWLDE